MGMTLAQLAAEKQNEYKDEIILANVNGKLKELGEEFLQELVEVANGKQTKAETLGYTEMAIARLCNYV